MDLHEPTDPPPPFDTMYETLDGKPHEEEHTRWSFTRAEDLETEAFATFRSHKLALYDGSLSFVDVHLARLVGYLERAGLRKDTVVVLTSDHGEEFWDHAEAERLLDNDPRGIWGVGHGHTMFRELLDVPLILNGSGVPIAVVRRQVRNVDIMPTLLGLAGVDPGDVTVEGRDLIADRTAGRAADLLAFSENLAHGYEMKAIQDSRYKYVLGRHHELLFDRVLDPLERRDVVGDHPEVRDRLEAEIRAIVGAANPVTGRAVPIDATLQQQLRELGYIR
jgi:arylsulfatase A-like enzyme